MICQDIRETGVSLVAFWSVQQQILSGLLSCPSIGYFVRARVLSVLDCKRLQTLEV